MGGLVSLVNVFIAFLSKSVIPSAYAIYSKQGATNSVNLFKYIYHFLAVGNFYIKKIDLDNRDYYLKFKNHKMRNLILLIFLSLSHFSYCYAINDSIIYSKVDSLFLIQSTIDLKQNDEIKSTRDYLSNFEIKESLFSNQLSILTAIFSAIVAISIFIIGYLIPKLNEEKHTAALKQLLSEFESIRDEIKKSREETAKVEAQNNYNNSKVFFFSCADTDNKNGELLWALRHAKDNFVRFEDPDDKDIEFYIERAFITVKLITQDPNLREYVDEINGLTSELIEMYNVEGFKEKLTFIKEEYNKIAWTNTEKKKKMADSSKVNKED